MEEDEKSGPEYEKHRKHMLRIQSGGYEGKQTNAMSIDTLDKFYTSRPGPRQDRRRSHNTMLSGTAAQLDGERSKRHRGIYHIMQDQNAHAHMNYKSSFTGINAALPGQT